MASVAEAVTGKTEPRLGLMAATLAHEIRNPLASISTNGETLRAVLGERSDGVRYVDAILDEVDRIETLVSSVLRFAGRERLCRRPVSLLRLASRVIEQAGGQAARQGVRLALAGDDRTVPGDDDLLERLIDNLVRNALEAMASGGELTLSIEAGIDGGARITVSDTGPGLPSTDPEHVFEPFFTTRVHGMGLGLPLSRRIAQRHGGRLAVGESDDRGTTFVLDLPGGDRDR